MHILVVDDNKDFCDNLRDVLEFEGHKIDTVYDGCSALVKARDSGYDLVLLDLVMPGLTGDSVLLKLKEIAPQTPVVILTVLGEDILLEAALKSGADGYLKKPFDLPVFLKLVNNIKSNCGV